MNWQKLLDNHYAIAFGICLTISIGLIITSFFTPPMFIIDSSVLKAVGELFLYPSLAFAFAALREGRVAKIKHKDTEITIGEDNQEEETAEEI